LPLRNPRPTRAHLIRIPAVHRLLCAQQRLDLGVMVSDIDNRSPFSHEVTYTLRLYAHDASCSNPRTNWLPAAGNTHPAPRFPRRDRKVMYPMRPAPRLAHRHDHSGRRRRNLTYRFLRRSRDGCSMRRARAGKYLLAHDFSRLALFSLANLGGPALVMPGPAIPTSPLVRHIIRLRAGLAQRATCRCRKLDVVGMRHGSPWRFQEHKTGFPSQ